MALIPPQYLNAVVSIEIDQKDKKGQLQKICIATGFLLGTPRNEKNEESEKLYNLSLVTNRHVYEDSRTGTLLKKVFIRFNTIDNQSRYLEINLLKSDGTPLWFKHKNDKVDIAIIPLNGAVIKSGGLEWYFFHDKDIFYARDFDKNNISTGDGLFVLGFPMGISGKAKKLVIVRQGIIARVDDEILDEHYYYIDASMYPGNSGGPVIHKPEILSIIGTKSNSSAGLIGVISAGETYSDVAISQQTKEPRIIFTEQTGLVRVVPIESVVEAIDEFITHKKAEKATTREIKEPSAPHIKK